MAGDLTFEADLIDDATDVLERIQERAEDVNQTVDDGSSKTGKMRSALSSLRSVAGKVGPVLGGIAAGIGAVGAAAGAAATKVGVEAVQAHAKLGEAVRGAAAKVDRSAVTMRQFREAAIEAGQASTFSASKAGKSLQFLAQAGFEANEATKALPKTLQLAEAGNLDLARAADIASNVLSGYGKEVSRLGDVNDILVKTSSTANTNVQQLGQAFELAAPVAKSAGVSIESTAAAIGTLSNAGIQASRAGTTLRGAISKILSPSKQAQRALDKLGVSVRNSQGEFRGLIPVLQQLEQRGASTTQVLEIFGRRAGTGVAALLESGVGQIRQYRNSLKRAEGAARSQAEFLRRGLNAQFKILQGSVSTLAAQMGKALAPEVQRVTGFLTVQSNTLSNNRQAMDTFRSGFDTLTDRLADSVLAIGKLIGLFKDLMLILEGTARGLRAVVPGLNSFLNAVESAASISLNAQGNSEELKNLAEALRGPTEQTQQFTDNLRELTRQRRQAAQAFRAASGEEARARAQERFNEAKQEQLQLLGQEITRVAKLQQQAKGAELKRLTERRKRLRKRVSRLSGQEMQRASAGEGPGGQVELEKLRSQIDAPDRTGDTPPETPDGDEGSPGPKPLDPAVVASRRKALRLEQKRIAAQKEGRKARAVNLKLQQKLAKLDAKRAKIHADDTVTKRESLKLDRLANQADKARLRAQRKRQRLQKDGNSVERQAKQIRLRAIRAERQGNQLQAAKLRKKSKLLQINSKIAAIQKDGTVTEQEQAKLLDLKLKRQKALQASQQKINRLQQESGTSMKDVTSTIQSGIGQARRLGSAIAGVAQNSRKARRGISGTASVLSGSLQAGVSAATGNPLGAVKGAVSAITGVVQAIGGGESRADKQRKRFEERLQRKDERIKDLEDRQTSMQNRIDQLEAQRRSRDEIREDIRQGNLAAIREAQQGAAQQETVIFQGNTFLEETPRVQRRIDRASSKGREARQ